MSWPASPGYAAFAGSSGYAATSAAALDTTKSFTVAAWVYVNNLTGYQAFLTQQGTNVGGFHLEFENNGANGNVWTFARAATDTVGPSFVRLNSPAGQPQASTWTHLIASWDADNATMYLYVNGQLVGTAADPSPIASNGPLVIGRGFVSGIGNNFVDGGIADVRVYQQAFGSDLASYLYQNTGFGKPAIPVFSGALISSAVTSGNASRQVCVDDIHGDTTNSTSVVGVWDCNHGWTQAWQFATDGTVRVMSQTPASPPNKCLDTGGVNTQGSKVTLFDCQAGNPNQVWKITPSSWAAGQIAFQNPATGLCLDVSGGNTADGNPLQLWACQDGANQHYFLPTASGENQSAEGESVGVSATGGTAQVQTNCCGASWSNGAQEWLVNSAPGSTMTLSYYVANAGTYAVAPVMTKAADYGIVQVSVDGSAALPNTLDGYNNGVTTQQFTFGTATLSAGMHTFTFTVTGTNAASVNNRYNAGVDVFNLLPTTS